jgi:catechol 2,3-dioxygenase-like lactoylglutathione lyase family enzyme
VISALRHIGLVVYDLPHAIHIWRDILGFRIIKTDLEHGQSIDAIMGLNNVVVTTVKLQDPRGNLLELLHFHSHSDTPHWQGRPYSTGFTHVALTVQDIDSVLTLLVSEGFVVAASPQSSPDGRVRFTYAHSPEGVILELVEEVL